MAGKVICSQIQGDGVAMSYGRSAIAMPDSNYTLTSAQYQNRHLSFSGALTTSTKNAVVPLVDGAEFVVYNGCTGQAIKIIGATGTGIDIAVGKTAIVRCDGTNWLRVTADNP